MFLAGFEPEILESDVSDLLLVPLCRIDISLVSVSYSANIKRNGSVCILGKLSTGSHEGLTIFKEVREDFSRYEETGSRQNCFQAMDRGPDAARQYG